MDDGARRKHRDRNLATIDLVIIGVYFLLVFCIGFYFARKERTSTDYFLASRDIGWFFIGASLFVSNISTEHFIGLSGTGASSGLAVGHFEWLACLILLILGWVFVPFYLRSNVFTMPEFLERRFNRQCAVYLAGISIIAYIFTKISVQLYAASVVLERVAGWSLWKTAIILVIIVALIGFWDWRSALLMALSIPITLAMTFGMMYALGIDLQQVSIATLIIALGLLVDDPVVAGDSIKRALAEGHPPIIAAWLGPTKLATAIMYATVTNIVAYLPKAQQPAWRRKLERAYAKPTYKEAKAALATIRRELVMLNESAARSLVASRLVSMTFIPLLSYYLLRPKRELPVEERRQKGFAAFYYRVGTSAINHR